MVLLQAAALVWLCVQGSRLQVLGLNPGVPTCSCLPEACSFLAWSQSSPRAREGRDGNDRAQPVERVLFRDKDCCFLRNKDQDWVSVFSAWGYQLAASESSGGEVPGLVITDLLC